MPRDLSISDLHRLLTERDGVLPDGTVEGSTEQDWPSVVDLIQSTGWPMQWADTTASTPQPDDGSGLVRVGSTLAVWPVPAVQINLFPGEDVSFDFDRREIRDEAAARALGDFIRQLGTRLRRKITVTYEGTRAVLLRYDPLSDSFHFPE